MPRRPVTHLFLAAALVLVAGVVPQLATAAGFANAGTYVLRWEGLFTDARRTAMGNADLAEGGGPQAVLVNPAYLDEGPAATVSYDRMNYLAEIDLETLAAGVSLGSWRVTVARNEISWENELRTAYEPSGTGDYIRGHERLTVVGLSLGDGDHRGDSTRRQWAFGMNYRHYEMKSELNDEETMNKTTEGIDAGATFGWRRDHVGGWTSVACAAAWQNIFKAKVSFDEREALLPRHVRLGFTFGAGFRPEGRDRDAVAVRAAFTRTEFIDSAWSDESQWGAEVTALQVLSLRWGTDQSLPDHATTWGLGLRLAEPAMGPWRVELHWVRIGYGDLYDTGDDHTEDGWGARVAYIF